MKNKQTLRVGVCKHTGRDVLQVRDNGSDDALDAPGWMCLHGESVEEDELAIKQYLNNQLT